MNDLVDTDPVERFGVPHARAFLFDLDGVLWDSNRLHADTMARVCEEAGLTMPEYDRLAGLTTPAAFELVLSESAGPSGLAPSEFAARKRTLFQERVAEIESDHEALVEELAVDRPDFLALVTGASRATADAFLRRLPEHFFDLVITSDDGLASKPMPDAYLFAAGRLGVKPSECVVFEDSRAGLAAARAAGARVAHITSAWEGECDTTSCGSDWCAPTVREALRLIRDAS